MALLSPRPYIVKELLRVNSYLPKKKRGGLPAWVEENLQLLVIAGLAFFVLVVLAIGSTFTSSPPPVQVSQAADLDVVMGPVKTWEDGSTTRLKAVQLKIKNRGEVTADGVVVMGKFRGISLQLTGKTQLVAGEVGDYTVTFPVVILSSDPMEFTAECGNCVPFGEPHR
jgi:hypothetical protein